MSLRSAKVGIAIAVFISTMYVKPANAQPSQAEPSSNANERFEISPRGYVQFDWRGYPDWTVATGSGRLEYETFAVRRLRAGIDGQWRRMAFEFTVDPMDDLDDTLIKDATYRFADASAAVAANSNFRRSGMDLSVRWTSLNDPFSRISAPGRDIGGLGSGSSAGGSLMRRASSQATQWSELVGTRRVTLEWRRCRAGGSFTKVARLLIRNRRMVSKDVRSPVTGFRTVVRRWWRAVRRRRRVDPRALARDC
jgi:hypothetical protein